MSGQGPKILLLEDNPTHRKLCAFNLTRAGYQVTVAGLSQKALSLARHQTFDLVITDYHLPDHRGSDFTRLLRQVDGYERTPVILQTRRTDELKITRLSGQLFDAVLPKPCNIVKLVETVSKSLADARCKV